MPETGNENFVKREKLRITGFFFAYVSEHRWMGVGLGVGVSLHIAEQHWILALMIAVDGNTD